MGEMETGIGTLTHISEIVTYNTKENMSICNPCNPGGTTCIKQPKKDTPEPSEEHGSNRHEMGTACIKQTDLNKRLCCGPVFQAAKRRTAQAALAVLKHTDPEAYEAATNPATLDGTLPQKIANAIKENRPM